MTWYPGCVKKPYIDYLSEPVIIPTQFIIHSMASAADEDAVWNYFNNKSTFVESHFLVGFEKTIQGQDTHLQADANYRANVRAISCETRDNGDPDNFRWTPWQVTEIVRLMKLAHTIDKIPAVLCPDPTSPGFGYHSMFGAPSDWTPVVKSCPGAIRIRQFKDEVWPKFLTAIAKVEPMSDGIKPVLIRIGKKPEVYQIIAGAYRVHVPDGTSFQLMGWKATDVVSITPTHKFATLPILKES